MNGIRRRGAARIALALLFVVVCAMRLHTLDEPAERDLDIYAVIGHELLAGRTLYDDLFDQKPPGPYLVYAAGELLFGYGSGQRFGLGLLAAWLTLAGLYRFLSPARAGSAGGLWAAATWAVLQCDLLTQANQPNTEAFINAALVWAMCLLAESSGRHVMTPRVLGAALLLLIASLFKHVVVVTAAMLALAHVAAASREHRGAALRRVLVLAAAGALGWLSMLAYFAATGRGEIVFDTLFTYSLQYARLGDGGGVERLLPVPPHLAPLVAIAVLACLLRLRREPRAPALYTAALAVGAVLTIALMGHKPHYYQLWLPVVAASVGLAALGPGPEHAKRAWRPLVPAAVVVLCLALEAPAFLLSPEQWSQQKYGDTFVHAHALSARVGAWLHDDETLFEWGAEPGFYVDTKRSPINGCVNVWFTLPQYGHVLAEPLTRHMLRQLRARPPDLLLVEQGTMSMTPPDHPMARFMLEHYRIVTRLGPGKWIPQGFGERKQVAGYLVGARKGSRLQSRIRSGELRIDRE